MRCEKCNTEAAERYYFAPVNEMLCRKCYREEANIHLNILPTDSKQLEVISLAIKIGKLTSWSPEGVEATYLKAIKLLGK